MLRFSFSLVLYLALSPTVLGDLTRNETCPISIPGFTNHGNCNLLCRQAKWTDIIIFYIGNYVAHAATILSKPGQSLLSTICTVLLALLFPSSGVVNGIEAMSTLAIFAPTELRTAARAGALCMVVKWPERVQYPPKPIRLITTKVHGKVVLPDGYALMVVPKDTVLEDDPSVELKFCDKIVRAVSKLFQVDSSHNTLISSNYNFVKILVSLGQTLFAVATIYRTRGDQISKYGYAAFGLTVIPYAWMSLINLFGNLIRPEYPALYLVESETLDQLRNQVEMNQPDDNILLIQGTVGRMTKLSEADALRKWQKLSGRASGALSRYFFMANFNLYLANFKLYLAAVYLSAVPIAVVGGLTGFHPESSTLAERVWVMLWLIFGIIVGAIIGPMSDVLEGRPVLNALDRYSGTSLQAINLSIYYAVLYSAPAIGGYVVVGQMMKDYGVCMRIS